MTDEQKAHLAQINAALHAHGVIWRACVFCRIDWPFPAGDKTSNAPRDFKCPICCAAELAELHRAILRP